MLNLKLISFAHQITPLCFCQRLAETLSLAKPEWNHSRMRNKLPACLVDEPRGIKYVWIVKVPRVVVDLVEVGHDEIFRSERVPCKMLDQHVLIWDGKNSFPQVA